MQKTKTPLELAVDHAELLLRKHEGMPVEVVWYEPETPEGRRTQNTLDELQRRFNNELLLSEATKDKRLYILRWHRWRPGPLKGSFACEDCEGFPQRRVVVERLEKLDEGGFRDASYYDTEDCERCGGTGAEPCEFHRERSAEHRIPGERVLVCGECWQDLRDEELISELEYLRG